MDSAEVIVSAAYYVAMSFTHLKLLKKKRIQREEGGWFL